MTQASICSFERRSKTSIQRLRSQDRAPELIIAELWSSENNRPFTQQVPLRALLAELPGPMTERDEMVANEVVQWLGTACGLAFLKTFKTQLAEEGYHPF